MLPIILAPCKSALRRHWANWFFLHDWREVRLQNSNNYNENSEILLGNDISPSAFKKLCNIALPHFMHWLILLKPAIKLKTTILGELLQEEKEELLISKSCYNIHLRAHNFDHGEEIHWSKIFLSLKHSGRMHYSFIFPPKYIKQNQEKQKVYFYIFIVEKKTMSTLIWSNTKGNRRHCKPNKYHSISNNNGGTKYRCRWRETKTLQLPPYTQPYASPVTHFCRSFGKSSAPLLFSCFMHMCFLDRFEWICKALMWEPVDTLRPCT